MIFPPGCSDSAYAVLEPTARMLSGQGMRLIEGMAGAVLRIPMKSAGDPIEASPPVPTEESRVEERREGKGRSCPR